MEQQNNNPSNQNKDKNPARTGGHSHGGRRNHHRPRGGRSGHRGGGQDIKTKDGYYLNQTPSEEAPQKKGGHGVARNEQRSRSEERGGAQDNRRGGSAASGWGGADRSRERSGEVRVQSQPVVATAPKDRYVSPTLARVEDRWMDDTFASLHEIEVHDEEAEAEARRILDAEGPLLFGGEAVQESAVEPTQGEPEADTVEVVGIRFKSAGKKYYFAPGSRKMACGSYAIVETARGEEYGEVCQENTRVKRSEVVQPLRAVLRAATEQDTRHHEENKKKEDEAFRVCQQKIAQHGLDMKLVEAQYTFDNSKLLFYFTSDGRVDFRELVKDLAGLFRTRIELRQIGIRDEAKLLGGLGTCGRPLCCYGFLSDFVQVSIKMAKEQNLSLNSNKISGCCGRLMCCLRYEFETYQNEIRLTPAVGTTVETPDGKGEVVANHPLKGTVTVRLSDKPEEPARVYHRDGVTACKRTQGEHREKREASAPAEQGVVGDQGPDAVEN